MEEFLHLAAYYEALFPARPAQLDFLEQARPDGAPPTWVDIACGTGQQMAGLANRGLEVWGLDLDETMLAGLWMRRPDLKDQTIRGDMRQADRLLSGLLDGPAGVVYCIGNSLVQLTEDEAILESLRAFHYLLAPGGGVAIQIVNFDRVLEGDYQMFPPLERTTGDGSAFILERRYEPSEVEGCLEFHTRLITSDGIEERRHGLRALNLEELKGLLDCAGFHTMSWYGDYDRTEWSPASPATIVTAIK
jgi:SAM-dependent methyltransferase